MYQRPNWIGPSELPSQRRTLAPDSPPAAAHRSMICCPEGLPGRVPVGPAKLARDRPCVWTTHSERKRSNLYMKIAWWTVQLQTRIPHSLIDRRPIQRRLSVRVTKSGAGDPSQSLLIRRDVSKACRQHRV